MDSKLAFIEDYERGQLGFSELCRRHQISRPCGYKWVKRYEEEGLEGLEDQSRRPRVSPLRSCEQIEEAVVEIRKSHPVWGGRKIQKVLQRKGYLDVPAPSTVTNILRRQGLLGPGTREGAADIKRFERSEPNDLWQMDFKGWFELDNRKQCHPLTALDDCSRYNLILEACPGESNEDVRPVLIRAFRRYGLPRQILCDHGPPWGRMAAGGVDCKTSFEVWLMRLGVDLIHGRVRRPQTQGKEERFHRTLKAEVLDRSLKWKDHRTCQKAFNQWQRVYNHERPHEALDYSCPAELYQLSHRSYPIELPVEESYYLKDDVVRKVKSKGEFSFKNVTYYLGRAFTGCQIALRPLGGIDDESFDVFYCWKHIGIIHPQAAPKKKGKYQHVQSPKV